MTNLITTDLSPVPSRAAPTTFSAYMDTWLGKISAWTTEANALATGANTNATTATTQAGLAATAKTNAETAETNAETAATNAAASALTALNAPGTNATSTTSLTVGIGSKTLTIQTGKSIVVGMSVKIAYTTTPTTWMHGDVTSYNSGTGELIVTIGATSGSGTQTAWTVSLSAPGGAGLGANTFTGQQTFVETMDTIYDITDGANFEIDPANGNIQTITLGANRTAAATNFAAGQLIYLGVNDGTAYALTWPTVTWVKYGGTATAPTLPTSGYLWVKLWKVGTTLYAEEGGRP